MYLIVTRFGGHGTDFGFYFDTQSHLRLSNREVLRFIF